MTDIILLYFHAKCLAPSGGARFIKLGSLLYPLLLPLQTLYSAPPLPNDDLIIILIAVVVLGGKEAAVLKGERK